MISQEKFRQQVEKEMRAFRDYRDGIGQFIDPQDITKVVLSRLSSVPGVDGIEYSRLHNQIIQRVLHEEARCTERHVTLRIAELRAQVHGTGAINARETALQSARIAFCRWFRAYGTDVSEYESHPLYLEILELGDQLENTNEKNGVIVKRPNPWAATMDETAE